jgi:fimbrial chaperone protein
MPLLHKLLLEHSWRLAPLVVLLLASSFSVTAGNFGVSPIRLDLDRNAKTGAVTVSNDDEGKLQLQMRAFEWTQDTNGQDRYVESADLIFVPKLMSLDKKEQRVIRTGTRVPATEREKTYRLFIEEIPEPRKDDQPGAHISVAIRFGVPVFVRPLQESVKGEIERAEFDGSNVKLRVRNNGNVHFVIGSVDVSAGSFLAETKGWYLLAGAARDYSVAVPADVCRSTARLELSIKADKLELKRAIDVDKSKCMP